MPFCYHHYKLDNVIVKKLILGLQDADSGAIPTEIMKWEYDKIAAVDADIFNNGTFIPVRSNTMSWDDNLQTSWTSILENLWEIMGL